MFSCFVPYYYRSGNNKSANKFEAATVHNIVELNSYHNPAHAGTRLLLLGSGESGKTTIFKQMQFLQRDGDPTGLVHSEEELKVFKLAILSNIFGCMRTILLESDKLLIKLEGENKQAADLVRDLLPDTSSWTAQIGEYIIVLWADKAIQETFNSRDSLYQLNESAYYFFNNLARINKEGYQPSDEDLLNLRIRTSGMKEADFKWKKKSLQLLDVGGQRPDRRKWANCFEGVTAVVFCASLSEYDQVLREDGKTNRMTESIALFKDIINSKWLKNKSIILFLTKTDLLQAKMVRSDFKYYHPAFPGASDNFDEVREYIVGLYKQAITSDAPVSVHYASALNTDNIRIIFDNLIA